MTKQLTIRDEDADILAIALGLAQDSWRGMASALDAQGDHATARDFKAQVKVLAPYIAVLEDMA